MRATAGMLSASHNPFEDNGLKVFSADGHKLSDDIEKKRQLYFGVQDYDFPYGAELGCRVVLMMQSGSMLFF